jgi:hypothetical protein
MRRIWACYVLTNLLSGGVSFAADGGLVAWWKFDEAGEQTALDGISGIRDRSIRKLTLSGGQYLGYSANKIVH